MHVTVEISAEYSCVAYIQKNQFKNKGNFEIRKL